MTRRNISLLQKKAEEALKSAVRKAIEEHKRSGVPLVIWQNGKMKLVAPTQKLIRKVK
ncbi:MAG: hypothetical protein KKH11_05875 [Candidatus Omnitrophica bacterium]|nr:hypothetical protein [Candidatus Omnitrophota bacterium]MBU4141021.1 hypothetical protein [Candidatus Omnitrophota bacterium]